MADRIVQTVAGEVAAGEGREQRVPRLALTGDAAGDDQQVHARLYRHARVTNTLIRAYSLVQPLMVEPRAWISKAGPSKEVRKA